LIWDVGHQAYPHKILTGRRDRIRTLRQGGGLSGFTKRAESDYDPFGAAHAATSISAALGFCAGRGQRGGGNSPALAVRVSGGAYRKVRKSGKTVAGALPRPLRDAARKAEEYARGMV